MSARTGYWAFEAESCDNFQFHLHLALVSNRGSQGITPFCNKVHAVNRISRLSLVNPLNEAHQSTFLHHSVRNLAVFAQKMYVECFCVDCHALLSTKRRLFRFQKTFFGILPNGTCFHQARWEFSRARKIQVLWMQNFSMKFFATI